MWSALLTCMHPPPPKSGLRSSSTVGGFMSGRVPSLTPPPPGCITADSYTTRRHAPPPLRGCGPCINAPSMPACPPPFELNSECPVCTENSDPRKSKSFHFGSSALPYQEGASCPSPSLCFGPCSCAFSGAVTRCARSRADLRCGICFYRLLSAQSQHPPWAKGHDWAHTVRCICRSFIAAHKQRLVQDTDVHTAA